MEMILITFGAFIFGIIIGSFLNVVRHRVPRDESIVYPGSHCASCGHSLRAFDNIPLISYAILGGKCRDCRAAISPTYPLVEFLTGAIFVLIVLKGGLGWESLLEMIFASVMLSLVFIDARHHLIPNVITYPAIVFSLAAITLRGGWGRPEPSSFGISIIFQSLDHEFPALRAALIGFAFIALAAPLFRFIDNLDLILFNKYFEWEEMEEEQGIDPKGEIDIDIDSERSQNRVIYSSMIAGLVLAALWAFAVIKYSPADGGPFDDGYNSLLGGAAGAIIGGGLIWTLRALYFYIRGFEGMGLGDVKMMAVIGAFLGWQSMFGVMLLGSILGTAIGVALALRARKGLRTPLPFGACLGLAAIIIMFTSKPMITWYLNSGR